MSRYRGAYRRHGLVDECLQLSTTLLGRRGITPATQTAGSFTFVDGRKLEFTLKPDEVGGLLMYLSNLISTSDEILVDQTISLVSICPPLGGYRWLFSCPMLLDPGDGLKEPCGAHAGILYLPPGASSFGCRGVLCHDLTYRSRYRQSKRRAFIKKHPDLIDKSLMEASKFLKEKNIDEVMRIVSRLGLPERSQSAVGSPKINPLNGSTQ